MGKEGEEGSDPLKTVEEVWEELSYRQKLAATAIVFEKIEQRMNKGTTFRCLIYDKLGFGPDAYNVLYNYGGMEISNWCTRVNDFKNKRGEYK